MKLILLILLTANLVLYGAMQGWLGADTQHALVPAQREPERASQQIAPTRVRVLTPAEARAPIACIELSPALPNDEADRLATRIDALGARGVLRAISDTPSYMVHLPPFVSKAEADRVASELRGRGIDDLQVLPIEAGAMRNAISLGVYRAEDAANTRVATLRERGVTNVRISVRPGASSKSIVEVRQLSADAVTKLDELLKTSGANRTERVCAAVEASPR